MDDRGGVSDGVGSARRCDCASSRERIQSSWSIRLSARSAPTSWPSRGLGLTAFARGLTA